MGKKIKYTDRYEVYSVWPSNQKILEGSASTLEAAKKLAKKHKKTFSTVELIDTAAAEVSPEKVLEYIALTIEEHGCLGIASVFGSVEKFVRDTSDYFYGGHFE